MRSLKILRNLHGRLVRLKTSSFLFGGHDLSPSSLSAASIHSSVLMMQSRNFANFIAPNSSVPPIKEVSKELPAHASDKQVLIDQVFEAYKSRNRRGPDHDSCIETLRKLQEIKETLFPIGISLSKTPSYYVNKKKFLDSLVKHSVFLQVISDILEHRNQFSSEALTFALWFLNCLEVAMKSTHPQEIIEELLTRKNTFSLQALSTFYRCMRCESTYGYIRIADCFPVLESFLNRPISTVSEFTLLSECVHRSVRILPVSFIEKYLQHVQEYCEKLPFSLQVTTLCSMLSIINEARYLMLKIENYQPALAEKINVPELIRGVCHVLEPRISEMDEKNMLSLSKFLEFSFQPPSFQRKASQRAWELVTPDRLDLMTVVTPSTHMERMWLLSTVNNFLDDCAYVRNMSCSVFVVLLKAGYDPFVYHKYFSRVKEMLERENQFLGQRSDQQLACISKEQELHLEDSSCSESVRKRKLLAHAQEYVVLKMRNRKTYTHPEFEGAMKKIILDLFESHKNGNAILIPKDYAKAFAFLLATDYKPVELDPSFLRNLNLKDLDIIRTGAELGNTDSFHVLSAVCKRSEDFYRDDLEPRQLIKLARINALSHKLLHSYSIYPKCVESLVKNTSWNDSKTAKDLMHTMIVTAYNYRPALERVSKFLIEFENEVSSECVTSFLGTSFLCGAEDLEEAMPVCVRSIERDFDKIHPFRLVDSALALCYHRALSKCIIDRIFSDNFIERFDIAAETSYLVIYNLWPLNTKRGSLQKHQTFMALHRAVCLHERGTNLPWIHRRFSSRKRVSAIGGFCMNVTLHEEVGLILEEKLGREYFSRNIAAPYGYYIDFVVCLNESGELLKIPSSISGRNGAVDKIAVVVQGHKDYTTNAKQLKGLHLLKNRHLEVMGYRVVNINPWTWDSLEKIDTKVEHLMTYILKKT